MNMLFSEVLSRIEKFLAAENPGLNIYEKAVLNTVLIDFKVSIDSGRYDRYTERRNPVRCEIFILESYHDHVMYMKKLSAGFEVKTLHYNPDDLDVERLEKELEKIGLEVEASKYRGHGFYQMPMRVYYTIPRKK